LGGKGGRCVGLTTLLPSCADCLEIWGASNSWKPQGLSRPVWHCFTFALRIWVKTPRALHVKRLWFLCDFN